MFECPPILQCRQSFLLNLFVVNIPNSAEATLTLFAGRLMLFENRPLPFKVL